jgi:lipoprotein NlpI
LGLYYRALGRYDDAATEYKKSFKLDSTDIYAHLNYYLALYQDGKLDEATQYLYQYSLKLQEDTWPANLVLYFNNELDENELMNAAEIDYINPAKGARYGEAYYYLGLSYLLNIGKHNNSNNPDTIMAVNYLKKCLNHEKDNIVEYRQAKVELARLRKLGYN